MVSKIGMNYFTQFAYNLHTLLSFQIYFARRSGYTENIKIAVYH